ncbi:winged helix DNA-binding domain-containing protein [Streptomyces sannanensis]|uniref:Winged helix DNA-binding domain-containing protein n=1 Tax=Streptomyces sannanensis TaxID=285536 RepID=A0ABP6S3Z1_9ACTN
MTPSRPRITPAQRRALLGTRHLLAPAARAARPEEVAEALTGLHASDPATVYLAVAARMAEPTVAALDHSLYEERSLVRMLCMRRTMFVVPIGVAPVIEASVARAVAIRERTNLLKHLRHSGGFDEAWLKDAEEATLAALARRGEATAAELADDVPVLRERITLSPGKPYETTQRVSSRVVGVLGAQGRIRRSRPLGTWASSQFRWTLAEPHPELPAGPARAELARRYLSAFGPAATEDLKWWTGWTVTDTRKALAAAGAVDVHLDEGPGHALPEHLEELPAGTEPWAALLPGLDPTAMGWRHRDWYLDPGHKEALFDRTGNIGPTVWWNGRIIGAWAQREDGEIVWKLLQDAGTEARAAIESEAARLSRFLGDVRVTPSFRTPLERQLAA